MSCERIRERIPELLAERLEPAERDRLMEHIEGCSACRTEMAELGAVWRGMASLPAPEPNPAMKARFLELLEAYQMGMRSAYRPLRAAGWNWWPGRAVWQVAFASMLLLLGVVGGRYWGGPRRNEANPEIAQLQGQIENLRQVVALSLLQEDSASSRIRGVSYSFQMAQPDSEVEQALLQAVNHDSNVNVRLAAVDALAKYAGNPAIRRALVDAVPAQDSPLVQVALIDLLAQLNEKDAVPMLRKLAADAGANEAVRQRARWGLGKLEVSR
jgi:hypothetical protein